MIPDNLSRFSKSMRINKEEDFSFVFAQPNRSVDKFFSVISRDNNLDLPRLGLSISKKVVNLAVERNRIKRVVRSAFIEQINLKNHDFIVMARRDAVKQGNKTLRNSLCNHFKKI